MAAPGAPAPRKAATTKSASKKAAARKAAATKAAATKSANKKAAAAKAGKKVAGKRSAVRRAAPGAEPTEAPSAGSREEGEITSWNPSSGRGTVRLAAREVAFDLMKTKVLNQGYVDLHVGRQVAMTSSGDEDEFTCLEAL